MKSIGALCGGVTPNGPGHAHSLINLSLAEGYMLMTLMFELIHFSFFKGVVEYTKQWACCV